MNTKDFYQSLDFMDLDEFFAWLKQRTEAEWSVYPSTSFEDYRKRGVGGSDWRQGTKWIDGLSEGEIAFAEQSWNLRFPPDYRRFLAVLGAPDQFKFGAKWSEKEMIQADKPSFYNWRQDTEHVAKALRWPLEGLLFDVDNGLWYESWGNRPKTKEERHEVVSSLVSQAPPLIPIVGHRYLLGDPIKAGNPILSVYQSDIIIYGTDIRRFLLLEMAYLLNLNHDRAYKNALMDYDANIVASIPFWGAIITGGTEEWHEST